MAASWTRSTNEVLATLQEVVAIESVNPKLPGGNRGERGMVAYLAAFFDEIDIPYETHEVFPGRENIVATLEGEDPNHVLLFDCHMDTASVGVMTIPPFEPHIRDGKLYGRGACDTKSGGVAMIHAMKRLKEAEIRPPWTIQYSGTVDEERGFRGIVRLVERMQFDAAVVAEPTDLRVVRAHKGYARFQIHVRGVAAHSSKPHLGVNAITKMARLIRAIDEEIAPSYEGITHPLTGGPTVNIGVISGGAQVNFVPDHCWIEVDRRVIPGETPDEAMQAFEALLERERTADPELNAEIEVLIKGLAMETDEGEPIVQTASRACARVLGASEIAGVPFGTHASALRDAGVPSIVLGPGSIDQAHAAVEWVECEQVLRAVEIYEEIMRTFGAEEA